MANTDSTPRREAIRTRLAAHLPLYRLSRYRPPRLPAPAPPASLGPHGETPPTTTAPNEHGDGQNGTALRPPKVDVPAGRDGEAVDDELEAPAEPLVDLPDVAWVSARDDTRAPGDLEDQAARYHLERHELTINADFRVIADMAAHWARRYQGVPGARPVINAQIREWFEQTLAEVVLSARNSHWDTEQLTALLSPQSFSAALLPRQLLYAVLQKRLAQKLGPPRQAVPAGAKRS